MVKLVDTWDLKSQGRQLPCEFESRPGHRLSDFINTRKMAYYAVAMPWRFLNGHEGLASWRGPQFAMARQGHRIDFPIGLIYSS